MLTVLLVLTALAAFPQDRPFIVVKESEYEMLRERSDRMPWSAMKANAVDVMESFRYQGSQSVADQANDVFEFAGALALVAVLEPDRKPEIAARMGAEILDLLRNIKNAQDDNPNSNDHNQSVKPAQAAFMAYILLDIMYDGIDPDLLAELEGLCDFIMDHHHPSSWAASRTAGKGMMALYHSGPESDTFKQQAQEYYDYLASSATPDGVYTTGPGYSYSRLYMDNRIHKKVFMDVCEYNGFNEFYDNPKFSNMYEWIFGYVVTPFNRTYTFGDSPPTKSLNSWDASALRANRFSADAQAYAAWVIGEVDEDDLDGNIIHYVFTDGMPVAAKKPDSRVFENGGAWFLQDVESNTALAGVLWNLYTDNETHSHYDANAIHIAGFGEHLLRNSGYDGWGKPTEQLWKWIRRTAESSNTLLIDHSNHISFRGRGISDYILGEPVEYAFGNSGAAIPIGVHNRHFYYVQHDGNLPGYFFLYDEARPFFKDRPYSVVLHPSSDKDPEVFDESGRYRFSIKKCDNPFEDIYLDIVQVTRPDTVEIRSGYLASYDKCSRFYGKYLYSTYPGANNEWKGAATILFPLQSKMNESEFTNLSTDQYDLTHTGLRDEVNDFIMVPKVNEEVVYGDVTAQGKLAYWREYPDGRRNISLNSGTKLMLKDGYGITSDTPVSFVMGEQSGTIISKGANVTFMAAGLSALQIDDQDAAGVEYGEGEATLFLEEGKYKISFTAEPTGMPDENNRGSLDFRLDPNFPNPFNAGTVIPYTVSRPGNIELSVFDVSGKQVQILYTGQRAAGQYTAYFNANNFASGVYYYRLLTEGFQDTRKMLLLR